MNIDAELALYKKGCAELLLEDELKTKLLTKQKLRVKLGFDPTAPDIHLGHTVVLNKLRQFQDHGHEILFLVGDFTAMIGDPTGKNVTRKPLTAAEVLSNAQTYQKQLFKVLDKTKTQIVYNSSWLQALGSEGIIHLAAQYSVARMLEREDFKKRYKAQQSIAVHEFLYPLIQGYDSVALQADVELGGTDQKFNLLVGRELQKEYGQSPQVVLMLPLLEGLDGEKKMSKSLNNYIGVDEPANTMFGKIMSISDELMWRYFDLLSMQPPEIIQALRQQAKEGKNPRDIKFMLANEIVTRFHSDMAAQQAQADFIAQFQKGQIPTDIAHFSLSLSAHPKINLASLLKLAGLVSSVSEGNRMLQQGAVKIDGKKTNNIDTKLIPGSYVIQVGKRNFCKVNLTE